MITVKDYAKSVGKTHQAVYKQMKSKKNQELLEGKVIKQNGTTYLTDEAVEILNQSRSTPIVMLEHENSERIWQLENENSNLLIQIANLEEDARNREKELTDKLLESKDQIISLKDQIRTIEMKQEQQSNEPDPQLLETIRNLENKIEELTNNQNKKSWWQFWK